jgi:hypothetical protein
MQHCILMIEQVNASNLIGKALGVKSVPIEFGIDGKRRRLHIKDLLQLEIAGAVGADHNLESHHL